MHDSLIRRLALDEKSQKRSDEGPGFSWLGSASQAGAFSGFQYLTPPVAVYPEEAIQAHLAFLARRRSLRPAEEYRVPTDEEWTEFLGHFERRKVSTGIRARAYSTPCVHEHACLRCSMHWPDPAQRQRIVDIRDNLIARIAEAEREGWLGETEGLRISLAGANEKLTQIDRRATRAVDLATPAIRGSS